jgi:DNA mismatch repair protein MutS
VPDYFVRRRTLANSERYSTPKLKELEEKLLAATDKRKSLEYKLFQKMRDTMAEARSRLLFMADLLAGLDYWQSLAEAARKWNWARPALHNETHISIKDGRHPVVEAVQGSSNFIPNDLRVDDKRKLLLITGPNMAGKSTVLRQMAIICILAQMGSYVPAREATIGIADRIFSRVGASDNLAQGQSTFMVEMMETARILRQATKRSLIILDEIGRGTSTFDGLSLAWAVVEELCRKSKGIRTLFATHYHELTGLEGKIAGVHNMNIAIKEWGGEIVFLRRLVPGPSDRSYGIEVANLAGVPANVVKRAKEILALLESNSQGSSQTQATAMASLLPGMPETPVKNKAAKTPPVSTEPVDHPLLTALKDLDTDNMTPMDALKQLTEWKLLWGEQNDAN